MTYDVETVRQDFPQLHEKMHGKPLVYLDSAATSLKPEPVIQAISDFYTTHCANIGRGIHALAEEAGQLYEDARQTLKTFFGVSTEYELIFTAGATDALNLAAFGYGGGRLTPTDSVMVSVLEHHSNYLPWIVIAKQTGCRLSILAPDENGAITPDVFQAMCRHQPPPLVLAITYSSNVIGHTLDIAGLTRTAHEYQTRVIVDAAQGGLHDRLDIAGLNADMIVLSAHKMLGPYGIGALVVRKSLLPYIIPRTYGGGMLYKTVNKEIFYKPAPDIYEAGTNNIAGAVAWARAVQYIQEIGKEAIAAHRQTIASRLLAIFRKYPEITLVGNRACSTDNTLFTILIKDIHPHDISSYLDHEGIAVRVGDMCCQPLFQKLGIHAATRISFCLYTNESDLQRMDKALENMMIFFKKYIRK